VSRTKIREIPTQNEVRTNDVPPTTLVTPASASSTPTAAESQSPVNENSVRELAYLKWQAAGSPPGDGVQFWLEAENELVSIAQMED
jgi:hypothetical protein